MKPLNGTLSRGLFKVIKLEEGYGLKHKQGEDMLSFSTSEEAAKYINEEVIRKYRYIIQQAINPLRVKGRHMDFRVIMQKNETLDWQCTGIIALIGSRGDICSNWVVQLTLKISYMINLISLNSRYLSLREKFRACKLVCEALESPEENYGDLGFDVVVDEEFKIWVLEANKRHYYCTLMD